MKKNLLYSTLFAFACIGISRAQITITLSDMPQAGTNAVSASDTVYNGSAGTVGTNQTWNFSSLGNHGLNATQFVTASSQPGYSNFTGSNLCIPSPVDSAWTYVTVNSGGVYMDGLFSTSTSFPVPVIKYNPALQLISLPSTYNTSFINNAKASFKLALNSPPVDSLEVRSYVNRNSVIDAWGTVTTPAGTFNALRQKVIANQVDSTFILIFGTWTFNDETVNPTETLYSWWANNQHYPVLEMSDDGSGVQGSVSYLLSSATGIKDVSNEKSSIIAYPNPAQDEMNFVLPAGKAKLEIFDISGKVIRSYDVNGGEMTIDVSELQNGVYSFRYFTAKGSANLNGKLIVNH